MRALPQLGKRSQSSGYTSVAVQERHDRLTQDALACGIGPELLTQGRGTVDSAIGQKQRRQGMTS